MNNIKLPPHNTQAEQAVIGALLLDNSSWLAVYGLLKENDFYETRHKLLFRALYRLLSNNEPADVLTVCDFLTNKGCLDAVGGLAYVGMLAKDTPSAANIVSYAKIVKDKSLLRQLIVIGNEITSTAYEQNNVSTDDLIGKAENIILKLRQDQMRNRDGFVSLREALSGVVNLMEENYNNPPKAGVLGISTGFDDLDKLTSGFQAGLHIIAARPSMGKSSLAMNHAEIAALAGYPVAVFSMEMPVDQLAKRFLAGNAGLPLRCVMQSWTMKDDEWPLLSAGLTKINNLPVYMDDSGGVSVAHIKSMCLRLNAEIRGEYPRGIGMIVVDYLQLMDADNNHNANANDRISSISRGLKKLAMDFNVPVLALSQLNRKVEDRSCKRPVMADLRDSGAIEQDADNIYFIYRDEVYNANSQDSGFAEINVAKQRNGALGMVRLAFDRHLTRFRDI